MPSSRSAALNLAREIAKRADVPIELVLGYFSFTGRLSTAVQQQITAAEVATLGMGRDRRTRRRILTLMKYADFWIETEFEGQSVTLNAA